jgi:hypothetical protein
MNIDMKRGISLRLGKDAVVFVVSRYAEMNLTNALQAIGRGNRSFG